MKFSCHLYLEGIAKLAFIIEDVKFEVFVDAHCNILAGLICRFVLVKGFMLVVSWLLDVMAFRIMQIRLRLSDISCLQDA